MITKQKVEGFESIGESSPNFPLENLEKVLFYCCVGYIALLVVNVIFSSFFGFSLVANYISDLGSRNFIPFPFFHDFVCVFGGLVSLPVNFFVRQKLKVVYKSSKHSILFVECGVVMGVIGNVGYVLLGIFSLDRAGPGDIYHGVTALISFSGYVFSIFFYSLNIFLSHKCKLKNLGAFGMIVPGSLMVLYFVFSTPLIEWFLLSSILLFLLLLNYHVFKLLR